MQVTATNLPGVVLLQPNQFGDARGSFSETWNQRVFTEATGFNGSFVQDNHSVSSSWVLRGLHYQINHAQGKLIRVSRGAIYDVAVDLRKSSPTFKQWTGQRLTADNRLQMWIPAGFAHGFLTLETGADVLYKATDFYSPNDERTIMWNDPELAIDWPTSEPPTLSEKDRIGSGFLEADLYD